MDPNSEQYKAFLKNLESKPTLKSQLKINNNIISFPSDDFEVKNGIGEFLYEKLTKYKDRVAQVDGLTGQKDTYGALLQRCVRAAIKMKSIGITEEAIVTVCSHNHLDSFVPIIAAFFLGAKPANVDPTLSLKETTFLLKQVQPTLIFTSSQALNLIENTVKKGNLNSKIVVFGEQGVHISFKEFLTETPEAEKTFQPKVADLNETAAIFFSSGTSGLPKGICLNHISLVGQTLQVAKQGVGEHPLTILGYSSLYWVSSLTILMNSTVSGQTRLILPHFDAEQFWQLVETYKVFMVIISPTQLSDICQNGNQKHADVSSLKLLGAGGGYISEEQIKIFKNLVPEAAVIIGYGLTELGGSALNFRLRSTSEDFVLLLKNPTSCGRPLPGYSYKVVDVVTGKALGPNQQGELRIKCKFCMNGYYKVDSKNEWDSDGFLKTGDLVYYDDNYCFFVVDRIREMLKYRGWQVVPTKLETILMTHPQIRLAIVIGIPHPTDGDHPMAIVTLNDSIGKISAEDIEKYVEERVDDKEKLRAGVKIVKDIPLTPSSKLKRKFIKDLIIEGKM